MGIRLLQLSVTNNKFCLMVETGIKISQFQNLFFDFSRLEIKKEYNDEIDVISTVSNYEAVDVDDDFKIVTFVYIWEKCGRRKNYVHRKTRNKNYN